MISRFDNRYFQKIKESFDWAIRDEFVSLCFWKAPRDRLKPIKLYAYNTRCPICMTDLDPEKHDFALLYPCHHVACVSCIEDYYSRAPFGIQPCSICRTNTTTLHKIYPTENSRRMRFVKPSTKILNEYETNTLNTTISIIVHLLTVFTFIVHEKYGLGLFESFLSLVFALPVALYHYPKNILFPSVNAKQRCSSIFWHLRSILYSISYAASFFLFSWTIVLSVITMRNLVTFFVSVYFKINMCIQS